MSSQKTGLVAKALNGITVLDFSRFTAAPYCAMLLADMGARVIRIERPGGGVDRQFGLMGPDGETFVFKMTARNKEGITLDFLPPAGQELLALLLKKTEVVVHNFTPGSPEYKILDYDTLNQKDPRLIIVAVSGCGASGPYAERTAFDATAKAMGGAMWLSGFPGSPPLKAATPYVDLGTGCLGAFGVMTALYHRERTGKGQFIDISLLDVGATFPQYIGPVALYHATGELRQQLGNYGFGVYMNCLPTKDGWVMIAPFGDSLWRRLCQMVGHEEMATDPRFLHDSDRQRNRFLIDEVLTPWFQARTTAEALEEFQQARIPAEKVDNIAEVIENPQIKARELIVYQEHPGLGPIPLPGVLPKMSLTPGGLDKPAPRPGEHNLAVYHDWLGLSRQKLAALEKQGII